MFDVPPQEKCRLEWKLELAADERPWNIGLIVGPSGSGKSTLVRHLWGEPRQPKWGAASVLDDFAQHLTVESISQACGAVGFNTIPAWLRPFAVLSNGEKFRVEMARLLLEGDGARPLVVDEFTSLVDRQVACIASHAVQKYARKQGRQLVAATCHYDVEAWLQPDWVIDMADQSFRWRELQRRPALECEIRRVPFKVWRVFAPFHYLSAELNRNAACFALYANGRLAAFAGMLHFPHPRVRDIIRCSRLVTLPDWQGLGLSFALIDRVAAGYKSAGKRVRCYPAHPSFVRSFARGSNWVMVKRPGQSHTTSRHSGTSSTGHNWGERPCAAFEYAGSGSREATRLLHELKDDAHERGVDDVGQHASKLLAPLV